MADLQTRLSALITALGADMKTALGTTRAISGGPTLELGHIRLTAAASVPTGTPTNTLIIRTP